MGDYAFTGAPGTVEAIDQLLRAYGPEFAGAPLNVATDDDMFAFSVGATASAPLGAMAYFRAGVSIVDLIAKVADWGFGGLDRVDSVLDFAAGYGRGTRFLVRKLPAPNVCVAEIQADALTFQDSEFGVRTLLSATDPDKLAVDRTHQLVFVSSLFTHLPDRTFGPWLAKLWEFVADGGLLVFSVHDEAINDTGVELSDGFAFLPMTEVASLSTDDYGVNFTTEAYVRRQVEAVLGPAVPAVRLPRALCFMQDVWVLAKGALPAGTLRYECGPNGALDRLDRRRSRMTLTGWAGDRGYCEPAATSHRIGTVEVLRNGVPVATGGTGLPRPDVAAHLGRPDDPVLNASGFSVTAPAAALDDVVTVVATCEHGARFVVDSTRVDDMLTRTDLLPGERTLRARVGAAYDAGGVAGVARGALWRIRPR
jgi:hypothetical protein